MTDYTKLVKALRERALRENEWYEHGGDIIEAAAAAIEALQAEIRESMQKCAECGDRMVEPKRGKWITHPEVKNIYGGVYIECPFCGEKYVVQNVSDEKFCRNCGADLRAKMEVQDA